MVQPVQNKKVTPQTSSAHATPASIQALPPHIRAQIHSEILNLSGDDATGGATDSSSEAQQGQAPAKEQTLSEPAVVMSQEEQLLEAIRPLGFKSIADFKSGTGFLDAESAALAYEGALKVLANIPGGSSLADIGKQNQELAAKKAEEERLAREAAAKEFQKSVFGLFGAGGMVASLFGHADEHHAKGEKGKGKDSHGHEQQSGVDGLDPTVKEKLAALMHDFKAMQSHAHEPVKPAEVPTEQHVVVNASLIGETHIETGHDKAQKAGTVTVTERPVPGVAIEALAGLSVEHADMAKVGQMDTQTQTQMAQIKKAMAPSMELSLNANA